MLALAVLFAALMTFLGMFLYLFVRKTEHAGGLRGALRAWRREFCTSAAFRRCCLLVFYTAIILHVTLLGRDFYESPLDSVMGEWWFYEDEDGFISPRWLENIFMLLPFTFLLLWNFGDRLLRKPTMGSAVWLGTKAACLFSLGIETLQLLLHVGTFQLSDLFYNTLGGLLGSLLVWPLLRRKLQSPGEGPETQHTACD